MSAPDPIPALRAEMERIDRRLADLIAERVGLALRLAEAKRDAGLPILDPAREAEVVRRAAVLARERYLPVEQVRDIFWRLVRLARWAQVPES